MSTGDPTVREDPTEREPDPSHLPPGTVLGARYTLRERLGAGGMGVVYRAWHGPLQREVALKTLLAELAPSRTAVQRFLREARACIRIRHRHAIGVLDLDFDRSAKLLYMVMDLAPGLPLSELLRRGALPRPVALAIALQVLAALEEAHRLGVLHRDLKPSNIMVAGRGSDDIDVKVLDFGLACAWTSAATEVLGERFTAPGAMLGTPGYMSPQQAAGLDPDPRGDVFSLGVVLYRMLAGRRPWDARDPMRLAALMASTPPRPLRGHPQALIDAVMRALSPEPAGRFPTARAFREALEACVEEAPPAVLRVEGAAAPVDPRDPYARPLAPQREELGAGVRVGGTTILPDAELDSAELPTLTVASAPPPTGVSLAPPRTAPSPPRPSWLLVGLWTPVALGLLAYVGLGGPAWLGWGALGLPLAMLARRLRGLAAPLAIALPLCALGLGWGAWADRALLRRAAAERWDALTSGLSASGQRALWLRGVWVGDGERLRFRAAQGELWLDRFDPGRERYVEWARVTVAATGAESFRLELAGATPWECAVEGEGFVIRAGAQAPRGSFRRP